MRPATEKTVTRLGTPMVHYLFIFKLKDKPCVLLSVHLRGEEDIEAGLYLDGSVVVYCNTITKS